MFASGFSGFSVFRDDIQLILEKKIEKLKGTDIFVRRKFVQCEFKLRLCHDFQLFIELYIHSRMRNSKTFCVMDK